MKHSGNTCIDNLNFFLQLRSFLTRLARILKTQPEHENHRLDTREYAVLLHVEFQGKFLQEGGKVPLT